MSDSQEPPPTSGPGGGRSAPLSLEELLQKKKEEEASLAKPKFLSKAERQALALKKRQEEVDAKRAVLEQQRREREALDHTARNAERHIRDREREERERRRQEWARNEGIVTRTEDVEAEKTAEVDAIKARYLGVKEQKRKIRRMNERKFVFDWEVTDDTSHDYNPLYQNPHEVQLFGRGHIAGIDLASQKKEKSRFYEQLAQERRTEEERDRMEERRQKERDKERQARYDDRPWNEKGLDEMTERDWRIFREDFNISTRGTSWERRKKKEEEEEEKKKKKKRERERERERGGV